MSSTALPELEPEEIEALSSAAAWYASYFRDEIAGEADDPSAYATVERERYLALCRALHKLGLRFALPATRSDGSPPQREVRTASTGGTLSPDPPIGAVWWRETGGGGLGGGASGRSAA